VVSFWYFTCVQWDHRKCSNTCHIDTHFIPNIFKRLIFCWPCITNLFKHTNVGISFRNTNTLQQLTKPKTDNKVLEQDKSGIYELTCNKCHMSYTGQTSRSLKQRYQEHIRYMKHNEPQSHYPLHILNNKHEYGLIEDTMTILKHIDETTLLIPYKQLYIQSYHHHKKTYSGATHKRAQPHVSADLQLI